MSATGAASDLTCAAGSAPFWPLASSILMSTFLQQAFKCVQHNDAGLSHWSHFRKSVTHRWAKAVSFGHLSTDDAY